MKTSDQPGPVYVVVPKKTQKEAMEFLRVNLFETPSWLMNKQVLDLVNSPGADALTQLADEKLTSLMAASRLQRLISSSNREKDAYGIEEYMNDLRVGIFSELKTGKPIDNYRRNLQKVFAEKLIALSGSRGPQVSAGPGITIMIGPVTDPRKSDILSVAKAHMRMLKEDINRVANGYGDTMSRYHLLDIADRIERAMKQD
jgi:hypothetical protein